MLKKIGLPNLIFIILSIVLIAGVLISFWVKSNLEVIESNTTSVNSKGSPSGKDVPDVAPKTPKSCVVTGCSSQLCAESEMPSTCEYREEYACYKNAVCERQSNGDCGWTITSELKRCIQDASSAKQY